MNFELDTSPLLQSGNPCSQMTERLSYHNKILSSSLFLLLPALRAFTNICSGSQNLTVMFVEVTTSCLLIVVCVASFQFVKPLIRKVISVVPFNFSLRDFTVLQHVKQNAAFIGESW